MIEVLKADNTGSGATHNPCPAIHQRPLANQDRRGGEEEADKSGLVPRKRRYMNVQKLSTAKWSLGAGPVHGGYAGTVLRGSSQTPSKPFALTAGVEMALNKKRVHNLSTVRGFPGF